MKDKCPRPIMDAWLNETWNFKLITHCSESQGFWAFS